MTLRWLRLKFGLTLVRPDRLNDIELIRALAAHVEGVPTFEAFVQLLEDKILECEDGAIASVKEHGVVASEVGAIQVLKEIRETALKLREHGRKETE